MYGLKDTDIEKIREVLSRYQAIDKAILYGSRAKGNYRNASDIDLSLVGNELDLNVLLKVENELDELLLPYTIDLSIFHQIENPQLVEHINRIGQVFYSKATFDLHNLQ